MNRTGIALLAALLISTGAALAWSPETQELIVTDAYQLVSPGLQHVLFRHREDLDAGLAALDTGRADPAAMIKRAVQDAQAAKKSIITPGGYAAAVQAMGRLAAAVAALNHPILPAAAFRSRQALLGDFDRYIDANVRHFMIYLPSGQPAVPDLGGLEKLLQTSLDKGTKLSSMLETAYFEGGIQRQAASFAPASVPFGVASLAYSAAVKDTAVVWLMIWQASGGSVAKAKWTAQK